jgi:DNA gyrase/topoisomerase IV subunit A
LIKLEQIEEWVREVEERPASAALIIRYIATRLWDLSSRNEELLAENIDLRTGRKVEDYESRIANLEYQIDLLRRQVGGEVNGKAVALAAMDTICFLVYTIKGYVLRVETAVTDLVSGKTVSAITSPTDETGPLRILATIPTEELLFIFDSGRTETKPVAEIHASRGIGSDAWKDAFIVETRGNEELVSILPIARMTLYDCCVQVSRRGCAKKMMKTAFESHVAKSYVGTGVKGKPDKTCHLVLCGKDDRLVLASREGFLWSLDVGQLPYTIEEVLKLSVTDFLISSFWKHPDQDSGAGKKAVTNPSIFIITHNGKVIHREASWLEKTTSYKSRGQAAFSPARREAGVRITGAALVEEDSWGAALTREGNLIVYKISDLLEAGSIAGDPSLEIVEFVTFQASGT